MLHDLPQHGAHLGNISRSINDEMEEASGWLYRVAPVDLADARDGIRSVGSRGVEMLGQLDLDTIGRRHGPGLRPTSLDLVDIRPIEEVGGDRLAEKGEVLQDPGVQ